MTTVADIIAKVEAEQREKELLEHSYHQASISKLTRLFSQLNEAAVRGKYDAQVDYIENKVTIGVFRYADELCRLIVGHKGTVRIVVRGQNQDVEDTDEVLTRVIRMLHLHKKANPLGRRASPNREDGDSWRTM